MSYLGGPPRRSFHIASRKCRTKSLSSSRVRSLKNVEVIFASFLAPFCAHIPIIFSANLETFQKDICNYRKVTGTVNTHILNGELTFCHTAFALSPLHTCTGTVGCRQYDSSPPLQILQHACSKNKNILLSSLILYSM